MRAALQERYTAATANKMLAALRQTLRMAGNLGYLSAEAYQRAVDLKPITGEQPEAAAGQALKYGEWVALLSICAADEGPAGVRDARKVGQKSGLRTCTFST